MTAENPLNSNGVADSRDLLEYKEFLENEILDAYTNWVETHNEYKDEDDSELEIPSSFEEIEFIDEEAFTSTCEDLIAEYEAIKDVCEELEGYGDFEYGETIIGRDYFVEAMQELCEEIGEIPKDLPSYIANNIDWDAVADELEVDYMTFTYNGNEYLMRA